MRPEKKTVYTLNVDNYSPEITALTYPLLQHYARRIGAAFHVIRERKFPCWPVTYEKLQIYELGRRHGNDWNLYIDSDALIHPDTIDFTQHIAKGSVVHVNRDMAGIRWKYDEYFRRDGRSIGSCNWFTIASDWCLDLWKPLEDLTLEQALENIRPNVSELTTIVTPEHLIDDYVLSRNIARYGLQFLTVKDVCHALGVPYVNFFWHQYTLSTQEKVKQLRETLEAWNIPSWRALTSDQ